MVTLRTYANAAEASLAKSLLDDHKIFCALADEAAHINGGAPLAMPVRLLVEEDQVLRATHILESQATERDNVDDITTAEPRRTYKRNNPWELLAIALLFLLPGMLLLLQENSVISIPEMSVLRGYRVGMVYRSVIHGLAWFAAIVALSLTILYFYARRVIIRDESSAPSAPSALP